MYKIILKEVLKFEGGYVNHPNDKGGATNFGVTQKTYDSFRDKLKLPRTDVKNISSDEVEQVYSDYWRAASCDKICPSHPLTAAVVFDCAINSGPKQAIKILQRVVKAKPIDGIIGRVTLSAVFGSNDRQLALEYLDARQDFFFSLVEKNSSQFVFLKGWLRRVNHLRHLVYEWSGNSKQSHAGPSPA